jgi:hypothetical protein
LEGGYKMSKKSVYDRLDELSSGFEPEALEEEIDEAKGDISGVDNYLESAEAEINYLIESKETGNNGKVILKSVLRMIEKSRKELY